MYSNPRSIANPYKLGFFIVSPFAIVRNNTIASGTKQEHKYGFHPGILKSIPQMRETDTTESPKLSDFYVINHKNTWRCLQYLGIRN